MRRNGNLCVIGLFMQIALKVSGASSTGAAHLSSSCSIPQGTLSGDTLIQYQRPSALRAVPNYLWTILLQYGPSMTAVKALLISAGIPQFGPPT